MSGALAGAKELLFTGTRPVRMSIYACVYICLRICLHMSIYACVYACTCQYMLACSKYMLAYMLAHHGRSDRTSTSLTPAVTHPLHDLRNTWSFEVGLPMALMAEWIGATSVMVASASAHASYSWRYTRYTRYIRPSVLVAGASAHASYS
jgi:hypothetical protein